MNDFDKTRDQKPIKKMKPNEDKSDNEKPIEQTEDRPGVRLLEDGSARKLEDDSNRILQPCQKIRK